MGWDGMAIDSVELDDVGYKIGWDGFGCHKMRLYDFRRIFIPSQISPPISDVGVGPCAGCVG